MGKAAPADQPIHELLRQRWSPVIFSPRAIEPEKRQSLWEAARWAPSSYNAQPWSFIVVNRDNPEYFEKFLSCLVPKNAEWAQSAPIGILSVAALTFEHNGKPNRHAFHDVGLAVENMVIHATAVGLCAHQMAGFDVDQARRLFHIPPTHEPVAAIAVGYAGDPASASDEHRQRDAGPRVRKPLASFVFAGEFGQPLRDGR